MRSAFRELSNLLKKKKKKKKILGTRLTDLSSVVGQSQRVCVVTPSSEHAPSALNYISQKN